MSIIDKVKEKRDDEKLNLVQFDELESLPIGIFLNKDIDQDQEEKLTEYEVSLMDE